MRLTLSLTHLHTLALFPLLTKRVLCRLRTALVFFSIPKFSFLHKQTPLSDPIPWLFQRLVCSHQHTFRLIYLALLPSMASTSQTHLIPFCVFFQQFSHSWFVVWFEI